MSSLGFRTALYCQAKPDHRMLMICPKCGEHLMKVDGKETGCEPKFCKAKMKKKQKGGD